MYSFTMLLGLMCASSALAGNVYLNPNIPYSQPPETAAVRLLGDAQAAAESGAAGARASVAKLDILNKDQIDKYGYQMGVPLLTRSYDPITNLYAASLSPGAFIGVTSPAFLKDNYGNIIFVHKTRTAALAI